MAGVSTTITTQRNPSFLDFAGGDGQATLGEKNASERGVFARGTSGVTTARCRKGKACGATCIDAREDCIIDFPAPVQDELSRMAKALMSKRGIAGSGDIAAQQKFLQEDQLGKAALAMGKQLTAETERARPRGTVTERQFGARQKYNEEVEQKQFIRAAEIRDLKKNRDKLADADTNPTVKQAWIDDVRNRGFKLSQRDVKDIYDTLPESAKGQLNGSGNPGKNKWYAIKDGQEITTGKAGNQARGLAVLDLYLRQGGTDAYRFGSNKTFSPYDLDIEHITPVSKGGLDHPSNWVLARSGSQRLRSDQFFKDFIDKLPDPNNKQAMQEYFGFDRRKTQLVKAIDEVSKDWYKRRNEISDEEFLKKVKLHKNKEPDAKGNLPAPHPVAKAIFRNENNEQDSFFAGAAFNKPGAGEGRGQGMPQPAGWAWPYLLLRKNSDDEKVAQVRGEIKNLWNKQWLGGEISTKELGDQVKAIYKRELSPRAFALVEGKIDAANNKLVNNQNFKRFGRQSNVTSVGGVDVQGLNPRQILMLQNALAGGESKSGLQEMVSGFRADNSKSSPSTPSLKPSSQPKSAPSEKPSPAVAATPRPSPTRVGKGSGAGSKLKSTAPVEKMTPEQEAVRTAVIRGARIKGKGEDFVYERLQQYGTPQKIIEQALDEIFG